MVTYIRIKTLGVIKENILDVTLRMKKKVIKLFRHIDRVSGKRIAIRSDQIYGARVTGKRNRGKLQLTFEDTVLMILKEGHAKIW